jgi:signal peptidase II
VSIPDTSTADEQHATDPSPRRRSTKAKVLVACVAGGVFLVDLLTKALVRERMDVGERISVIGDLLVLQHIHNRGIAFGLFNGAGGWVVFLTLIVGVVLALTLTQVATEDNWIMYGIALIAAGASGNILDRLQRGYVTDMIQLPRWPTFNVADIAISVGVVLVIISNLSSMRRERREG